MKRYRLVKYVNGLGQLFWQIDYKLFKFMPWLSCLGDDHLRLEYSSEKDAYNAVEVMKSIDERIRRDRLSILRYKCKGDTHD